MPRKIKLVPIEVDDDTQVLPVSAASSKISLSCLNKPNQSSLPVQSGSAHVKEPSHASVSRDEHDKENADQNKMEDQEIVKKSDLRELFQDILRCSKANFYKRMQNFDSVGKIVEESDEYRSDTLLHKAAEHLDPRSCRFLLGKNAKKHSLNKKNQSPLHVACQTHGAQENAKDVSETVRLLVCDEVITTQDANGMTPIHLAAMRGCVIRCEALFESYADKIRNVTDSKERTALHTAVIFRRKEVVKYLLRNKVHPDARDGNKRTALHEACYLGLCDIAKCIVNEAKSYWDHTAMGDTNLKAATRAAFVQGHINIVRMLQENTGVSLDELSLEDMEDINEDKFSQLMAIKYPFDKPERGWTVLHFAAKYNYDTVTEKLLSETNYQREAVEETGETPLIVAVRNKSYRVADILLEYGAPSNSSDKTKNTPLHIAIELRDNEMVKKLLAKGADPTIKNDKGLSSVNYAVSCSNETSILETLYKKSKFNFDDVDSEMNTLLHTAARSQPDDSPVTAWLAKKVEQEKNTWPILSKKNDEGRTPEIEAAKNGKQKTVKLFLKLHATKGFDAVVFPKPTYRAEDRQKDRTKLFENALQSEDRDTIKEILKTKDWREYLSMDRDKFSVELSEQENKEKIKDPPPLRQLLSKIPDCAMDAMWKCIYIQENSCEEDDTRASNDPKRETEISFDFTFIDDTYTDYKAIWDGKKKDGVKEMEKSRPHKRGHADNSNANYVMNTSKKTIMDQHPLMYMIKAIDEKQTMDLPRDEGTEPDATKIEYFRHPLILALIRYMFGTTFWIYLLFLLYYAVFILMFCAYMIYARRPHSPLGQPLSCANFTKYQPRDYGLTISIGILTGVGITIGAIVIYHQHDLYWRGNAFTWLIYVVTLLVIIPVIEKECPVRTPWQWQIGIFTVLLAWLNGLYMLRRFPILGLYVTMVQTIFKTFAKFAIIWFFSVAAFAVPYSLLFYNQQQFGGVWISGMKTAVMAFGEFDYSSIFHADGTESILYDESARIIFTIFIILMTIMVMNLLIALAVDDVSKLQKRGRVEKLKLLVELTLSIQLSLPRFLRNRRMKPNRMKLEKKIHPVEQILVRMEKDDFGNDKLRKIIMANRDKCSTGDINPETNNNRSNEEQKKNDQQIVDEPKSEQPELGGN